MSRASDSALIIFDDQISDIAGYRGQTIALRPACRHGRKITMQAIDFIEEVEFLRVRRLTFPYNRAAPSMRPVIRVMRKNPPAPTASACNKTQ
jgi:hypothetical protein